MTKQTHPLDALRDRVRGWAPPGVAVCVTDPTRPAPPGWPEEAPAIARARPARRREFAAGRHAARQAMAALGVAPMPIPGGPDRAPIWPVGVTGTISHDATSCIALVARSSLARGLGVDVEPDAPLPDDLIPELCVPSERAWLALVPAAHRARLARRIFCAKEALYKAQYPLTRMPFGFDAVTVHLAPGSDGFTATFTRDTGPIAAGSTLSGHVGTAGGHMIALVALGAGSGARNADFPVSAIG